MTIMLTAYLEDTACYILHLFSLQSVLLNPIEIDDLSARCPKVPDNTSLPHHIIFASFPITGFCE